jgi:CDP-diacylglycerol--glycerol-3-phosphate 3-phosphatidyltransferase
MIPNILTACRIILIGPLLGFLIFRPELRWAALVCFLLAGATDILDGFVARRFRLTSAFGAMFDKIADRLLTLGAVVGLIAADTLTGSFVVVGLLLVARDLIVASFNEALPGRLGIRVSAFERIKIAFCYGGLAILIAPPLPPRAVNQYDLGRACLVIGALMIAWTLVVYGRRALAGFRAAT